MYLEFFNQFVDLSLALWGLAIFTLSLATLAGRAILGSSRRRPGERPSPSFTCPCYAPPYVPPNPENS